MSKCVQNCVYAPVPMSSCSGLKGLLRVVDLRFSAQGSGLKGWGLGFVVLGVGRWV